VENAKVLIVAMDDREKISGIVKEVKRKYPHLKVLTRAKDIPHSFELKDLQADAIRRDNYDSSLNLGVQALTNLGFNSYQAHRAARAFNYHDGIIMDEMHKLWKGDRKKYIDQARRFNEQLENVFLAEKEQPLHDYDHAWDATSLREEVREIYEKLKKEEEED
jgi:hypothetical protein